ncbi:DinB family protein [Nocardioides KLBMP 9356]|uniref:DinB family protein n=1 Tax=Nocardioides potassii TaxID=2911371 RepID=A0ABS9H7R2_9ACTN|nr:DinB family protein [Nocardioides potassii]MCF6376058.1 DinB family protein [Nocardioides potassii]
MDDSAAKTNLHSYLRHERAAVLAKLDGLSEYDVRRPMTTTGTNLLGLVKHLATWEARYLGEVFGRPFPEPLPRWDVEEERLADLWATEDESRAEVVERYQRVWSHSDATIEALALGDTGRVEWWGADDVPLFNVLVHVLAETSRHAGHADILREELDGAVGTDAEAMAAAGHDPAFWVERRERIEAAARAAGR